MEEWWVKIRVVDYDEGRKLVKKIRESIVDVPEAVSLIRVKDFGDCFVVLKELKEEE